MTSFLFWNIFIQLFIDPFSCFIPFKWKKEKPIRGRYPSLQLQPIPDAAADRAERNTGADFTAHHTDMIFQFGYGSGFQCTILRLLPQHTTLWARICKPFKEPRNRFPAWRAGTTTLFNVLPATRLGKWRNRFLGSLNVYKYGLC